MAALGWLTAHLETWFAKSWLIATLVAGLAALGIAINDGMPWILAIVVVAYLTTVALSRTLDREDRAGPLADALATAICVAYARPFEPSNTIGRLPSRFTPSAGTTATTVR